MQRFARVEHYNDLMDHGCVGSVLRTDYLEVIGIADVVIRQWRLRWFGHIEKDYWVSSCMGGFVAGVKDTGEERSSLWRYVSFGKLINPSCMKEECLIGDGEEYADDTI